MTASTLETTTVADVETDQGILVARALNWGEYNELARSALTAAGLGDYLPAISRAFSVDLDKFHQALSTTIEIDIHTASTTPDLNAVARAVRNELSGTVEQFIGTIFDGEVTAEPVKQRSKAVDVRAIVTEWGNWTTPYPAAGSPEVETARRTTIRAILQHGYNNRYCPEMERALREIGLGGYLPPESKHITVPVPGYGHATGTVNLTRVGDIADGEINRLVTAHILAQLEEREELIPVDAPV
ncbi:hypothetical protein OG225_42555 (plasmid) [Nocardia sp. NBC_01377]|uniref:hypothetical protein n=1 Tax=Nocardia sp. NBC_01377 TaxID=2903595 RepID=UPI002F90AD65